MPGRGEPSVACAIALVAMLAAPAEAQRSTAIVLIAPPASTLANRLRAEAVGVGFALIYDPRARDDEPLAAVAARNGATGVIRVGSDSSVIVFLSGPGGATSFDVILADSREGQSFTLRVMEEIRARLVALTLPAKSASGVGQARRPDGSGNGGRGGSEGRRSPDGGTKAAVPETVLSKGVVPQDPVPKAAASKAADPPATEGRAGLGVAPFASIAATAPKGGLQTTFQAEVGLRAGLSAGWAISVRGLLPLTSAAVDGMEGTARVTPALVTAHVERRVWGTRRFSVWGRVGGGILLLALRSEPASNFDVGRTDGVLAATGLLEAGLGVDLFSWLALQGTIGGGMVAPRPVFQFDGYTVAVWGRPFALASIGLAFRLPLGGPNRSARP